jgi:hypothetical protein
MVDRFVNEAGEMSIARTRIEGELRSLRGSLNDLTENVHRLRSQLREIEIQAESQMQSRMAAAEAQHEQFDPLEMDRFTRFQELSRMMAESLSDVTTVQYNLVRNLDAADTAIQSQARLNRNLSQALMSVRMVPFATLEDRLYRVARQSAKETGKKVNLELNNTQIELDREVLEKMTGPIEHLLRNAVAHGIEARETREAAGKSETGEIVISLTQQTNEVVIELADDGGGLAFDRIRARAVERGLLGAGEEADERRLTSLIFEPGFTTAEQLSGLAGRGVGMDVVKNATTALGGRIETTSEAGSRHAFPPVPADDAGGDAVAAGEQRRQDLRHSVIDGEARPRAQGRRRHCAAAGRRRRTGWITTTPITICLDCSATPTPSRATAPGCCWSERQRTDGARSGRTARQSGSRGEAGRRSTVAARRHRRSDRAGRRRGNAHHQPCIAGIARRHHGQPPGHR